MDTRYRVFGFGGPFKQSRCVGEELETGDVLPDLRMVLCEMDFLECVQIRSAAFLEGKICLKQQIQFSSK